MKGNERMRYDKLLTGLEKARAAYENAVRRLLANASREDGQVAEALKHVGKDPLGRAAKKRAWTPARRRKQARLMKKRAAEKQRSL